LSYRQFEDGEGEAWDVWLVRPESSERRKMPRRKSSVRVYAGFERRVVPDRRQREGWIPIANVPADFQNGWLCFESESGEKRRLAPIPPRWEQRPDSELRVMLAGAVPVTSCGTRNAGTSGKDDS
jgi:hypothetical protein